MEDIIGILVVMLFAEIIFWGIAYSTGCFIVPIVSGGKWEADWLTRNEEGKTKGMKQSGFSLVEKSGKLYLGAVAVSLIGLLFWVLVILGLSLLL